MTKMTPSQRAVQQKMNLSRRRFLKGVSACIALPAFESLMRGGYAAAATQAVAGNVAVTSTGAPLRMAFVYFPNGAIQPNWWPTGEGKDFELAATMQPFANLKNKIQV